MIYVVGMTKQGNDPMYTLIVTYWDGREETGKYDYVSNAVREAKKQACRTDVEDVQVWNDDTGIRQYHCNNG